MLFFKDCDGYLIFKIKDIDEDNEIELTLYDNGISSAAVLLTIEDAKAIINELQNQIKD